MKFAFSWFGTCGLLSILCLATSSFAQKTHKHVLFWGTHNIQQKNYAFDYAFRPVPNHAWVLAFSFTQHQKQPDFVFPGDSLVEYALQQIKVVNNYTSQVESVSGWEPYLEARSFDPLNQFLPRYTAQGKLGYRFYLQREGSVWRWSLMPSVFFARHHFWEILDEHKFLGENYDEFVQGTYPHIFRYYLKTQYFEQVRRMRPYYNNLYGINYEIMLAWHFLPTVFLEARAGFFLQNGQAYKDFRPANLNHLGGNVGLLLGFQF